MIQIIDTQITVDDQVVSITEPFIRYALEDIEGFGIDGGVKFGGTSPVFFLDEGTMNKYQFSDAIGNRPIIYGKKDGDTMRVFKSGVFPGQDATELNDLSEFIHLGSVTVLMVADFASRGDELVTAAKLLKSFGADGVYAYVSHLDTAVLEGGAGSLIECLNNGSLIDELFTADIVYMGYGGNRISVITPVFIQNTP